YPLPLDRFNPDQARCTAWDAVFPAVHVSGAPASTVRTAQVVLCIGEVDMSLPLAGPPIQMVHDGHLPTAAEADGWGQPPPRAYRQAAVRVAFRALIGGQPAAELLHVFHASQPGEPVTDQYHVIGSWLVADPTGSVSAHRGAYVGTGGPWELA